MGLSRVVTGCADIKMLVKEVFDPGKKLIYPGGHPKNFVIPSSRKHQIQRFPPVRPVGGGGPRGGVDPIVNLFTD